MSTLTKYEHQKTQLDYLKSIAKIATESRQYQNMTEASLLNLMLSAQDLGISPMKAINGGFYVVNGKVCMSTALMADRIRKAGHSIKILEMSKDKCVILAIRKDNGDSLKLEYTWEDATLAGLTSGQTWKKFPKWMLYNRCMSAISRILFSDVIGNSYSEEERFDIQNVPAEERPLEDPEQITLEVAQPERQFKLTEEQTSELDVMLTEFPEVEENIKKALNLESIYDMNPSDFPKIMKTLNKRKKEKEHVNTAA